MQNAVPKNEGGMVAVLGENIDKVQEIIQNNKKYVKFFSNLNQLNYVQVNK